MDSIMWMLSPYLIGGAFLFLITFCIWCCCTKKRKPPTTDLVIPLSLRTNEQQQHQDQQIEVATVDATLKNDPPDYNQLEHRESLPPTYRTFNKINKNKKKVAETKMSHAHSTRTQADKITAE